MDTYTKIDAYTVFQSETDDRYARIVLVKVEQDSTMFYLDYELNFGAQENSSVTAILETVGENEDRMQHHDSDTIYFNLHTDNEIEARRKFARVFLDITEGN